MYYSFQPYVNTYVFLISHNVMDAGSLDFFHKLLFSVCTISIISIIQLPKYTVWELVRHAGNSIVH